MPKNNTAYKFRIYPNEEQKIMIAKTFGCCRFIYNSMLADKIEEYEKNNRVLKITPAGYKKANPWLKEVDSLALCNEGLHLDIAFKYFFDRKDMGFPRFKSKHRSRQSYTTNMVNNNFKYASAYLSARCASHKSATSSSVHLCLYVPLRLVLNNRPSDD